MNISVLIPTYNRACFIKETLESVVSQLDKKDELIILDDGSTDDTESICRNFLKNARVSLLRKNIAVLHIPEIS